MLNSHFRLGEPSAKWSYCNDTGDLLFGVWRFDLPGSDKQILPLSLWREPPGKMRWRKEFQLSTRSMA
jgi:putative DNA primase/helicase